MKVGVVRGATLDEVKSKKFNIYVGISLGNKWFTKNNLKEHLIWALEYTKNRVGLLVGDTLHAINYEVRNGEDHDKARRRALRKGDEMITILRELIGELSDKQKNKVDIIRWDDVKENDFNKKFIPFFYKEFRENKKFREYIMNIVREFSLKDDFSEEEIESLSRYILEELPELLHGFLYKETYYNCYTYPYDGALNRMVEKIQNKKLFPHFNDSLDLKQNVFVELR